MVRYLSQFWFFSGMLAMLAIAATATVSKQTAVAQTGAAPPVPGSPSHPCHFLTSAQSIPQGSGAAYNLFSAAKELLVKVECGSSSDATLTIGNGQNTTYVYRFGYEWTGTQWKQIALSGSQLTANDWYVGTAQANLFRSQTQLAEDNFVVAYTCQWMNNAWKCGCRDAACAANYWQLQTFRQAGPPEEGPALGGEAALCYPSSGTPRDVSNAAALQNALASASPGDRIVLAGGTYSGTYAISRSGTATAPIVISAAAGATPVFTGTFTINANHTVLTGMQFAGGHVRVAGDFNRITRNRFSKFSETAVFVESGSGDNRIDHNEFSNIATGGTKGYVGVAIYPSPGDAQTTNNRIDHNYFHDFQNWGVNGHEAIWLGVAATQIGTKGETTVDHNLFERINSDYEIIKVVTDNNRIIGNTWLDSRGLPSIRQGSGTTFKNNYAEGMDGMNVRGDNHIIIGNRILGRPIRIMAGETTHSAILSGTNGGKLATTARNVTLIGNHADVIVGYRRPGTIHASDTVVEANSGTVTKDIEIRTSVHSVASQDPGTARKLLATEVGPAAYDPSCP